MTVLIIIAILVVSLLIGFFIWKGHYVRRIRKVRDEMDITTPEGRFWITVYNNKIDQLNGYKVFKRTRNK